MKADGRWSIENLMLKVCPFIKHLISLKRALAVGLISVFTCCSVGFFSPPVAWASVAPSQQPTETVNIHLGNAAGELVFEPNHLTFVAGKRYKLVLDNPSPTKHYFTSKDFSDVTWTQKVEAGNVEVKGMVHELELKPGAEAEWVFISQKPGTYELHCSIAGHAEAGMVGTITVASPD
ncbi:MAG: cupredoxin domain-containing protein [Leptolyngbyaceae bacterium]|nr:cupredoxin domain-containing protein [Leptolyngbyaceae bacterium]